MNLRGVTKLEVNLVKNENGELLADSHNTFNRWKNYFSQYHVFFRTDSRR
jgi:hypothetical protein